MKAKILTGLLFIGLSACLDTDVVNPLKQLNKDVKAIDAYLEENPPPVDHLIIKDATGIRLVISDLGTEDLPPNMDNQLKVNYTGKYLSTSGLVLFETGTYYGTARVPYNTTGSTILGWQFGLPFLSEGAHAKLYIPSSYAYGASGNSSGVVPIPKNANLVFDIHMENIDSTGQIAQLKSDTTAIETYLTEEEPEATVIIHPSGMRYQITEEGSGASPGLYDQVRVKYKAKLLANADGKPIADFIAQPNSTFSSRVVNFPQAVIAGLKLLKVGGKAVLYAPSTLAYGSRGVRDSGTGQVVVPINANMIFEIELLEILE